MQQFPSGNINWLFGCPDCKFEQSTLSPGVGAEVLGIETLRRKKFALILDVISDYVDPRGIKAIEVGCNRGWFLDAARSHGIDCVGIEPDLAAAAEARSRGHTVYDKLFPDALIDAGFPQTDVIVFNDVFEHLPDVRAAKTSIHQFLKPHGLLVLNLPNSNGVLYRLAKVFAQLGWSGPLERLWQKGLTSPHLSYFNPQNLELLFGADGCFSLLKTQRLDSLQIAGLWSRLRSGGQSRALSLLLYIPLALTAFFSRLLPSDIQLLVFRKA